MLAVHAYIEVTDLARGIEFYCGGLGLTQKRQLGHAEEVEPRHVIPLEL